MNAAAPRWSIRDRLLNFATAGVESMFGVSFRHGSFTSEFAKQWVKGIEGLLGGTAMTQPYAEHPIVHQAIQTVSEDVALIAWQAYPAKAVSRKKATPLDSHPVLDWLERPAPGVTRRTLFEATTINYLLDGELYWYEPDVIIHPMTMPESGRLRSGGLELLQSGSVRWDLDSAKRPVARRQSNGDVLDLEKLTTFLAYNPYGPRGLGVMSTLMTDARADLGAAKWNAHMMADRNGIPNIVLKPPAEGAGTPTQRQGVKEKWESSFPSSRSGVGIVPPGWDLSELGGTRKDMEFSGLRSGAREMILGGIGLVPFLAGVLDKANYANAREQKFVYWRGTIARLLSRYEDVINNDLLPKLGVTDVKLYPQWETVRAMADDVEQKSNIAKSWFDMGLSKRVINENLEMGWDEEDIPDYDDGYMPAQYVPVADIGSIFDPAVTPAEPAEEPASGARLTAAQMADRRLSLWRLSVLRLRVLEKPTEVLMRSWFHDMERIVLDRVKSLAGMRLAKLGVMKAATSDDVNDVLFDLAQATRDLLEKMTPRIKAALITGGESVITDAGLEVVFNPNDMRLAAKIVEQQMKVRGIARTVREQLRETIQEGINLGESANELASRVTDTMGAAKTRATTIARTEMGTAYSNGRTIGMRQAGINKHEWLSARDALVRPDHEADDGERVDLGTPFPNSGLLQPLDPAGPPEQVINCRCTTLPVVTEE